MSYKNKERLLLFGRVLLGLIICLPVFLAVLMSIHPNENIGVIPIQLIPKQPSLENYRYVLENVPILTYFKNTVIMLIIILPIQVLLSSISAYAFAYFEFPGRDFLFAVFVTAVTIPGEVNIISNYMTIQSANLMDTYLAMTVTSFLNISTVFMLRQHMLTIPFSLWEAAKMDGCGPMKYFFKVILPLSKSVLTAKLLTSFISVYNAYLWPLMVTSKEEMRTLQTGIAQLVQDMYWNPGGALAGAVICMIIPIIVFVIGLDKIVSGLTSGAVKD